MASYDLIDQYLDALRATLVWRADVDDLVEEVQDHLIEATDRAVASGQDAHAAQRSSLDRFGDPAVVARAFATTRRGGLEVPTTATRSSGAAALAGAAAWAFVVLVTAGQAVTSGSDDDSLAVFLVLALGVTTAGMLTAVTLFFLWDRHGRSLGAIGTAGLAVATLGVVISFGIAWAVPLWMSVQGAGLVLVAIALLRRHQVPVLPVAVLGLAMPAGLAALGLVHAMGWGQVDRYGDRPEAVTAALVVAGVLMAGSMFGLGRWLRGEAPVDLAPRSATA